MICEAIELIYYNKLINFHAISATHARYMIWPNFFFFYAVHYDVTLIVLKG